MNTSNTKNYFWRAWLKFVVAKFRLQKVNKWVIYERFYIKARVVVFVTQGSAS